MELDVFPNYRKVFIKKQQLFIYRSTWSSQHDKNTVERDQQVCFYWKTHIFLLHSNGSVLKKSWSGRIIKVIFHLFFLCSRPQAREVKEMLREKLHLEQV